MLRLLATVLASALVITVGSGCGSPDAVLRARRACAFMASCPRMSLPNSAADNGGSCYGLLSLPTSVTPGPEAAYGAECARTSNNCQAFRDCLSRNHGAPYCLATPGGSCDGNVVVHCPPSRGSMPPDIDPADVIPTEDCALAGGECHAANNQAACTTATPCDPTMPLLAAPHCDGDRIVVCNTIVERIVVVSDCAAAGGTCAMSGGGTPQIARCALSGEACTIPANTPASATAHCDGDTTVASCTADPTQPQNGDGSQPGHTVRTSCNSGAFQGHCGTIHGVATCLPNDNACAPDSPDRCAGDTLEICVNGHYEGTACSSIGFARCTQRTHLVAACTGNAS